MKEVFAIVAKAPIQGFAKTRLADEIGDEAAVSLYIAFMEDFFSRLQKEKPEIEKHLFITPMNEQSLKFFADMSAMTNCKFHKVEEQSEGSLFDRLKTVFSAIDEQERCFIHLTGTDIPDFPFDVLAKNTEAITIGPDFDGGYYYLGARSDYSFPFDIQPESSELVYELTAAKVKEEGLDLEVTKTWSDVDCVDDLYETMNRDRMEVLERTRKAIEKIPALDVPSFS